MKKIAVFETVIGYLLWLGTAKDHAEAVRAANASVGLWETSAERSFVLERADYESLLVMELTEQQAQELQGWVDTGYQSCHYPDDLPNGVTYTSGEVVEMSETCPQEVEPPNRSAAT